MDSRQVVEKRAKWARGVVLCSIMLLVCVGMAVALDSSRPKNAALPVQAPAEPVQQEWIGASGGDAIEDFRVERAQLRDRELAELQNIIDSELTQSAERAQAQSRKMDILKWAEQETTMEGVLRARGYEQAVITVHQDSVNVLVKAESLSKHDSAIILELVSRETGQTGGNIKIIPLN